MHGTGTISAVAIVMKASGFSFVLMTRSRIRAWTGKVVRGQLGLRAGDVDTRDLMARTASTAPGTRVIATGHQGVPSEAQG